MCVRVCAPVAIADVGGMWACVVAAVLLKIAGADVYAFMVVYLQLLSVWLQECGSGKSISVWSRDNQSRCRNQLEGC